MPSEPLHTLLHLSDPHLRERGERLPNGVEPAGPLLAALDAVGRTRPRPAAVLFTGDLADSGQPGAYRRLRQLVEPELSRVGSRPIWVAGNHDHRAALRAHLLGQPPSGEPLDQVHHLGGLRVVVLDTTVPGAAHGELGPAQLDWLAAVLAEPAHDGTVLALHHPPLPHPSPVIARSGLREPGALAAVLTGSDVRVVLAGHTHLVGVGVLGGVPVWTGGSTAYGYDPLPAGRGERLLHAPTVCRVDLFADSVLVTAAPVDAPTVGAAPPVGAPDPR